MAMRVNHNIPALNALRNLKATDQEMATTLERLSSGLRVNRAADGPATLVISEQMRGQIASIKQAILNSEASISMVQTAEAALTEVNNLLISIRQLAIHAANEGANDEKMLQADQAEVENALDTIDRIARTSQFGTRTLLDGSNGANGIAVGEGLSFVAAAPTTRSSPAEGYPVNITQAATRARKEGERPITIEDLVRGFEVILSEGGKNARFSMDNAEDARSISNMLENLQRGQAQLDRDRIEADLRQIIAQKLQQKADQAGLDVNVFLDRASQHLVVEHRRFGSENIFSTSATVPGVLSRQAETIEEAEQGRDVEGTIDGKVAQGRGNLLTGPDNTDVQGLVVEFKPTRTVVERLAKSDSRNTELERFDIGVPGARPISKVEDGDFFVYTFEAPAKADQEVEGYVHITQNSLAFQVGPTRGQQVKVSLIDAKTDRLGLNIPNESGFRSLREANVTTSQGAQDTVLLVDDAIGRISQVRADLGAFQKNTLQSNTNSLRIAEENLTSAESSLRDADMAEEMSHFTRNQVMLASGTAMLAQANQSPQAVLQLLTANVNR
jgi:flagellin